MAFSKISKIITIVVLVALISIVTGCSSNENNEKSTESSTNDVESNTNDPTTSDETEEVVYTKDELAKYDGKNGNLAYVAVDGVVYDVTNSDKWHNGTHEGVSAGKDLSTEILSSPHGTDILKDVPVVGKYNN
ncbi:MAG: cytochrome b5 domain-containing protein [Clostridiales bacterium]